MWHTQRGDRVLRGAEAKIFAESLLELVKRYRVLARQEGLFRDIQIEKMEEWNPDEDLEIEFE